MSSGPIVKDKLNEDQIKVIVSCILETLLVEDLSKMLKIDHCMAFSARKEAIRTTRRPLSVP